MKDKNNLEPNDYKTSVSNTLNRELSPLEAFYALDDNRPVTDTWLTVEAALKDYENTKVRLDDTQTLFWEKKRKVDALDIIIKKQVEIGLLKGILHADKSLHTASYYNSHFVATYRHLTQEEYDLVKEVLLWFLL